MCKGHILYLVCAREPVREHSLLWSKSWLFYEYIGHFKETVVLKLLKYCTSHQLTMGGIKQEEQPHPAYLKKWGAYIEDILSSRKACDAAIYDIVNKKQLASSREDFKLREGELDDLLCGLRGNCHQLYANGVWINGRCYKVHMADGQFGLMAKAGLPCSGCSVCRTGRLLIVAVHDGTMPTNVCNEIVMCLGDFFVQKGF